MAPPFPSPAELLPHRPPMLLLTAVQSHGPGATTCLARFSPDFAEACGGGVSAVFGLELIAQTAAVHHGLRSRETGPSRPAATSGLLLGSRRLRFAQPRLPAGEDLRVTVFDGGPGPGAGAMIRFEGQVETSGGKLLVSGDATVLEVRPDGQPA